MPTTWANLEADVFSYLELPRNTTGDVQQAVQQALQNTLRGIVTDINPLSLLNTTLSNRNLSIKDSSPTAALASATGAGTGLTGTYRYVYTFYNSITKAESSRSAISTAVTVANQDIDLSAMEIVSTIDGGDKKRIYRTVAGNTEPFLFLAEIPLATTTHTDSLIDASLGASVAPTTNITLSLSTDFTSVLTNLTEILSITINMTPTVANSEPTLWEQVAYINYLNRKNDLPGNTWTRDEADVLHFHPEPAAGESWEVTINWMQRISDYVTTNEPEIEEQYRDILAHGAAAMFPQYFNGNRIQLFSKLSAMFKAGVLRIRRELPGAKSLKRWRGRKMRTSRRLTTWGRTIF